MGEEKPQKKGDKDKDLDFKPPPRDAEPEASPEIQEEEEEEDGKHKEFLVAQVSSVEPMKKKGQFVVELSVGDDKPKLNVVSSFAVEVEQYVVVAPEGASVNGKKVKSSKI